MDKKALDIGLSNLALAIIVIIGIVIVVLLIVNLISSSSGDIWFFAQKGGELGAGG